MRLCDALILRYKTGYLTLNIDEFVFILFIDCNYNHQLQCENKCINKHFECNRIADCNNKVDEDYCSYKEQKRDCQERLCTMEMNSLNQILQKP